MVDNDEPGQLMTKKVMSQLPHAVCIPKAVDWNSELIARFDRTYRERSKEIKDRSQQERKRNFGLSLSRNYHCFRDRLIRYTQIALGQVSHQR